MRMCKKLKKGVEYIANNDDEYELDLDKVAELPSVQALSNAFGKDDYSIAKEIIKIREIDNYHLRMDSIEY